MKFEVGIFAEAMCSRASLSKKKKTMNANKWMLFKFFFLDISELLNTFLHNIILSDYHLHIQFLVYIFFDTLNRSFSRIWQYPSPPKLS